MPYPNDQWAKQYSEEVGKIPVLNYEQERKLLQQASKGDRVATHILVVSNLRFVVKVARAYYRLLTGFGIPGVGITVTLSDLIQQGTLALYTVVEDFNTQAHSTRFLTYASWWIRQSMQRYLHDQGWPVKMPQEDDGVKVGFLNLERGADPDDPDAGSLVETTSDPHVPLPEKERLREVAQALFRDKFIQLVERANLDSEERLILLLRNGFCVDGRLTLEQLGQMFSITRERVRQIEEAALKRLRAKLTRYEKNQIREMLWRIQETRE